MKKCFCIVLAVLLTILSVATASSGGTMIKQTKLLFTSGIDHYLKGGKTIYYKKAKDAYNSRSDSPALPLYFVAKDIEHQIPNVGIILESDEIRYTAFLGCANKNNLNDILFVYYTKSGYIIADYNLSNRALYLLDEKCTEDEILNILDANCSEYSPIDITGISHAKFMCDMVYEDSYKKK